MNQNLLFDAGRSVSALAGFHTTDGVNHVIVGTSSGEVVELWWQGSGSVGSGTLASLGHPVVALAGYQTGEGSCTLSPQPPTATFRNCGGPPATSLASS